jgi:phosphoribosylanthranilate isomerase
VGEAIRTVRPAAVDTASGVERSPGLKDPDKLVRFITAARAAFSEIERCN